MYLSATLLISLAATALARPQDAVPAAAAGSKKNVYLATCTSRGLLDSDTLSAVIYYNGPARTGLSPTDVGTVSEPAKKWDGATRRTDLSAGRFTSKIAEGADTLTKSQLAGTATLGSEEFVCFVDGTSTFRFSGGLLGLGTTNCKADFWCASVEVGN
ncbi:hypothetical protein CC86DRAFT_461506 [Ophiobolus disseminans]|uniref:AA1-like domain-containing protein n=1 Tax=Ophiobolus disseminans TaxID=1469910 RepID=A0A6A7AK24_9PLEO|nr:hypothetical protein CC86DRAFT_461506 [Ophiobolus disseminans]